jgi:hypothetical protein
MVNSPKDGVYANSSKRLRKSVDGFYDYVF